MNELLHLSAGALARKVAEGEIGALELLEAHVGRLEAVNPKINAVVSLDLDRARARAREADAAHARGESWGPLHGVPFTVKDVFATRGMPTTIGARFLEHVPANDGILVRRLEDAGGILFGKTNLPFASYDWQCRDSCFGRCNNPYDLERVPGGSSSGSAAALAAGITAFELGSDVAGSIRVPAGFCGVVGLRPTEGLVDKRGHGEVPGSPHGPRSLAVVGPMARHVEDLELLLPLLTAVGAEGHSMSSAPLASAPAQPVRVEDLRLAWSPSLGGIEPARAVSSTIASLRDRLVAAGAQIEDTPPPVDFEEALDVWGRIDGAELMSLYPATIRWWPFRWLMRSGIVGMHFGFGDFSRALARGYTTGMRGYAQAQTRRDALVAQAEAFLSKFDAWICPVAPVPAFTHRRTGAALEIDDRKHAYADAMGYYSCPIVTFGGPVVSIPAGQDADGLPIAIQIVGRRFDDARLLKVARAIEGIAGGFRAPALR